MTFIALFITVHVALANWNSTASASTVLQHKQIPSKRELEMQTN